MALTKRSLHNFDPQIRQRGQSYYASQRVKPQTTTKSRFVATVTGASTYAVSLEWTPARRARRIEAACSCPYFAEGFLCKHVWATILAAEDAYQGKPAFAGTARISVDTAGGEDAHYEYDDVDDSCGEEDDADDLESDSDSSSDSTPSLPMDDGPAYQVRFVIERDSTKNAASWLIKALLHRPGAPTPTDAAYDASVADAFLDTGFVSMGGRLARWQLLSGMPLRWLTTIHRDGPISLADEDVDHFMQSLADSAQPPPLQLPADFPWQFETKVPQPKLVVKPPAPMRGGFVAPWIEASLHFIYSKESVTAKWQALAVDDTSKRLIVRSEVAERRARSRLEDLTATPAGTSRDELRLWLRPDSFAATVETLDQEGWQVLAGTVPIKRAAEPTVAVSSPTGLDWFDVRASVKFGTQTLPMPALLEALRQGQHFVLLDDGSVGLLPQEWLRRFGPMNRLGARTAEGWRFADNRVMILDALVSTEPDVETDAVFAAARQRLRSFDGIKPLPAPVGFGGTLRSYQEAGFGWMKFLAEFGLGGCLADDMGLGKTIQVLALLHDRYAVMARHLPSLVVVPKSLVHNWVEEARKFSPSLRVGVYAGPARDALLRPDAGVDVIVMTYNMLRLDVARLRDVSFDYVILDEAQHIKNEQSQVAKAARLIKARHRIAMSGTPVENHLRELGSIFEFLNPGMLGDVLAPVKSREAELDAQGIAVLGAALRPLILRRTKEQVLPDLPAKTEQTLYCDFEPREAKAYEELRRHYQAALKQKVDADGIAKTKIVVLEALLRLRQAACHPGLIDKGKANQSSAKVDLLVEQLTEVAGGGHKALVFSQFTGLLDIVRHRLDAAGLCYEYLDGKTKDRQARVDRFQTDLQCPIFLISLKAGGVGLNLTAADYCYILDPWWNPAAEAQAIDRAHRIGQTRPVFAYRLIARGTVEEKIVLLQEKKRRLADAIMQADESYLASMTAADLEALLAP